MESLELKGGRSMMKSMEIEKNGGAKIRNGLKRP
jgi:hypothetical protein